MDEEFKLCWKNFQDNIASGFQNLYDRGDLVDVTLACDGKLLHAHKIVLAICSPYFQEIFITNPCKHPIIILKDVSFNIMCELLEFMYQGVVNVKHAELQSFMKIGQLLQIKGLATNPPSSTTAASASTSASTSASDKSTSQTHNSEEPNRTDDINDDIAASSETTPADDKNDSANDDTPDNTPTTSISKQTATAAATTVTNRSRSPSTPTTPSYSSGGIIASQHPAFKSENTASALQHVAAYHAANVALKRQAADFSGSAESSTQLFSSRNKLRRSIADQNSGDLSDANESATGMDSISNEDFLLPSISMVESRYDLNSLKRDHPAVSVTERDYRDGASAAAAAAAAAAASLRNPFAAPFGFDYNLYKNSSSASSGTGSNSANSAQHPEYPNDLHMPNDYSKGFGNHMEIPPIAPGEHWFQGNLEFMLSQRGKPLLVHDGHTFGIQYVRKDKKYWQCNLSRKYNCKARVTTTETGDIIVTNNEHCHTEIRQHLRKDYQRQKVMMNALINLSTNRLAENLRRQQQSNSLNHLQQNLTTTTQCGGISPIAAHTNNATASMQRLFDIGKFSPEHSSLLSALQKHQPTDDDDNEENEPLDCGIRSAAICSKIKKEVIQQQHQQDSNGMLPPNSSTDTKGGDSTATSAEEIAKSLTPPHA